MKLNNKVLVIVTILAIATFTTLTFLPNRVSTNPTENTVKEPVGINPKLEEWKTEALSLFLTQHNLTTEDLKWETDANPDPTFTAGGPDYNRNNIVVASLIETSTINIYASSFDTPKVDGSEELFHQRNRTAITVSYETSQSPIIAESSFTQIPINDEYISLINQYARILDKEYDITKYDVATLNEKGHLIPKPNGGNPGYVLIKYPSGNVKFEHSTYKGKSLYNLELLINPELKVISLYLGAFTE